MSFRFRSFFRAWMLVPLGALIFLFWIDARRIQRANYVTGIAEWSVDAPVADKNSPTGYAGNQRRLIVPGRDNESHLSIAQTQRMLAGGGWRVRKVDHDNAPAGRESHQAMPARLWLAAMAWLDHLFSDRPLALAVEHAALFSDAALHGLLLLVTVIFAARRFGATAAALLSLGIVALFPFAGEFLPGAPDHHGLATACALWSVLPLLAGIRREATRPRLWFSVAGIVGGIGLWNDASIQVPILAGIGIGGLFSAAAGQPGAGFSPPWRLWALSGALTSLVAYMIEYFPADLHLRLEVNHPLYAIAWLGVGEWAARANTAWREKKFPRGGRDVGAGLLALAAMAALPVAMGLTQSRGFLRPDPAGGRLSYASDAVAKNVADWITRDGLNGKSVAVCLPLLLLAIAAVIAFRRSPRERRAAIAFVLGPAAVALGFAAFQLRWFSVADAMILALLVAVAVEVKRGSLVAATACALLPGMIQLAVPVRATVRTQLGETDVEQLVERDLAHWLARRTGGAAVVLASPDVTSSLFFHGGLHGLGTLDWENREGLTSAVRIASATSPQEALALLQQRGVTHIVLPSWDAALEDYARLGSSLADRSFITALKRWAPLVWLRPIPYGLPQIGGFEGQSVVVFEIVEERDEVTTLSAQAEYFVEMGMRDAAATIRKKLQRFPGDPGALVALAYVESTGTDVAALRTVFNQLVHYASSGADRALPWDRRVSLAGVFAQGSRLDLAEEQVRRCFAEVDEARVRSLTRGSLFRLLALGKKFGLEIADPQVRELARSLLPPDARARL